jgi:hypothetical protein
MTRPLARLWLDGQSRAERCVMRRPFGQILGRIQQFDYLDSRTPEMLLYVPHLPDRCTWRRRLA